MTVLFTSVICIHKIMITFVNERCEINGKVKTPVKISDSEWEIMRVIWTLGQTTAQEITQILADSMDWKPATIKTLLGRLVKRSDLDRTRRKKFIYHPAVSEMETVRSATENLFPISVQKGLERRLRI